MNQLVTVIIPAYNSEMSIRRCVESCLCQSYENIEIVVINDGSTDNTLNILSSIGDKRLAVVSTSNQGASQARNTGAELARGEWLFFLDADDYLEKDAIKILANCDEVKSSDIIIGQAYIHEYSGKVIKTNYSLTHRNITDNFLDGYMPFTLWPSLYRKKTFFEKSIKTSLSIGEDFVINAMLISSGCRYSIVKEVVYNYIKHENSITAKMTINKFEDNFRAYEIGWSLLVNASQEASIKSIINYHYRYVLSLMKINSPYAKEISRNLLLSSWSKSLSLSQKCNIKIFLLRIYNMMPQAVDSFFFILKAIYIKLR